MQRYPASPETTYKKGVISLDNVYLGYHLDNRVIIGRPLTIKCKKYLKIIQTNVSLKTRDRILKTCLFTFSNILRKKRKLRILQPFEY